MCASASKLLNLLSKQQHLLLIFVILVIPIGHQVSKIKNSADCSPNMPSISFQIPQDLSTCSPPQQWTTT